MILVRKGLELGARIADVYMSLWNGGGVAVQAWVLTVSAWLGIILTLTLYLLDNFLLLWTRVFIIPSTVQFIFNIILRYITNP